MMKMRPSSSLSAILVFVLKLACAAAMVMIHEAAAAAAACDNNSNKTHHHNHHHRLTKGFMLLPLHKSNIKIQKPFDLQEYQRFSDSHGVQRLWVLESDKPHTPTSRTSPRTEVRILGYDYSSGVWQFEGNFYVPSGTSGVCIMQVFGSAPPHATTSMLRVYNGSLTYYRAPVLAADIYDRWLKLNVVHDVENSNVKVYIDGCLKHEAPGRGGKYHYFKYGVYAQDDASSYMESRWKNVRIFRKNVY